MQEKHMVDKINRSYMFVDIVFGTHTLHKFAQDVYRQLLESRRVEDILDIDGEVHEGMPIKRNDDKRASVSIMYGCNNFCSYCIVPYVRGRERSRDSKDILSEIKGLAKQGYKEVTLLGQNVNSYNGGENYGFAKLLEQVEKIKGIEIIKFLSPHPKDFTDDVIHVMSKSKKISKLIHIPIQSGSTAVLKAMNRKYTKEEYLSLIEKIKREIPEALVSTDIIVGFPSETEEDFSDTLDVIERVNFEQVFMFIYSNRIGTLADKMENQISEEVKHERFERLKTLVDKQVERNNEKYIGTVQRILVEGISKNNPNMLTGRTDTNKIVVFEGNKRLTGRIVKIRIEASHVWYLTGIIVR